MKHIHLITRTIPVVLVVGLLTMLAACSGAPSPATSQKASTSAATPVAGPTSGEASSGVPTATATSALATYKAVLQGQTELVNTDSNEQMTIDQLIGTFASGGVAPSTTPTNGPTESIVQFAVVDLDQDGSPEVILSESNSLGFEILKDISGTVYGYNFTYRSFTQLKTDGTFSFSSGANDSGFGTMSCTVAACSINQITYSESIPTSRDGAETVSYYVNQNTATQDQFNAAMASEQAKPDVTWYDFTPASMNSYL